MAKKKVTGEPPAAERRRVVEILKILHREYPEAKCSLDYESPFQLLVATILSAQTTDERVNKVTPVLFARYPTARKMALAKPEELERIVQSTGFFRSKAKAILATSQALVEKYGGEVPNVLEKLVALRGVGRKTANVVLGNAYGIPGVVVDTHVGRLARRLGLTENEDPNKVEQDLARLVPESEWTDLAHLLISHGRAICTARRAYCEKCPIARYCPKIGVG